ncbi:GspE/PulE family protein [Rhizomicrobium electricum]|nr:GspE/PulE family protein [Rhizomicrobium electricum]
MDQCVGAASGASLLKALVDAEVLSVELAERVERAIAHAGASVVDVIVRLGLCDERSLASALSTLSGFPLAMVEEFPSEPIHPDTLSIPFLREARVLPIAQSDNGVVVAVADPYDDYTKHSLTLLFDKPVELRIAPASQIEDGIMRLYSTALGQSACEVLEIASCDLVDSDLDRLRESAGEAPIIRFVDRLIAKAVDAGASDIHFEPFERQLRVRLRVDGILTNDEPAPVASMAAIVSRIKIMAHLDIAERRLPQDGAMKVNVRGRDVDFRVATTPVVYGEEVVIRILDQSSVRLNLVELGFAPDLLVRLKAILNRPNGILLVTGPTGSGKSTTLYAALDYLNRADRKIITVEDPVEYKIEGLNQIQVKPEIGLDFARSLRSILRHDPDVIMVGEIRDAETARIAIQAALTGHIVLSTLHTNDAASAVTRLLDMGIEDYLITSTLSGVLAQRLVRTLCAQCRKSQILPNALLLRGVAPETTVLTSCGCPACRDTGFKGRTVIAELMELTPTIRSKVLANTDAAQLRHAAAAEDAMTLFESGLRAVLDGVTSYDEILRVAQDMEGAG